MLEESYEEFDFFLFDKLMDARSFLLEVLQNRNYPIRTQDRSGTWIFP